MQRKLDCGDVKTQFGQRSNYMVLCECRDHDWLIGGIGNELIAFIAILIEFVAADRQLKAGFHLTGPQIFPPFTVRSPIFLSMALSLEKAFSMGLKSGL